MPLRKKMQKLLECKSVATAATAVPPSMKRRTRRNCFPTLGIVEEDITSNNRLTHSTGLLIYLDYSSSPSF